jgi:hypothetical protein
MSGLLATTESATLAFISFGNGAALCGSAAAVL